MSTHDGGVRRRATRRRLIGRAAAAAPGGREGPKGWRLRAGVRRRARRTSPVHSRAGVSVQAPWHTHTRRDIAEPGAGTYRKGGHGADYRITCDFVETFTPPQLVELMCIFANYGRKDTTKKTPKEATRLESIFQLCVLHCKPKLKAFDVLCFLYAQTLSSSS